MMTRQLTKLSLTLLTLMFPLLGAFSAGAQTEKARPVTLEWDAVNEAVKYDLEIVSLSDQKKTEQFSQEPKWKGRLPTGNYQFRIRSVDDRGASGVWSEPTFFTVNLPWPKPLEPSKDQKIMAGHSDLEKVLFRWRAVGLADKYYFELRDAHEKVLAQKVMKDTSLELDLPVGQAYTWTVASLAGEDSTMKLETLNNSFRIQGETPVSPQIQSVAEAPLVAAPTLSKRNIGFELGPIYSSYQMLAQATYNSGSVVGSSLSLDGSVPISSWNQSFDWRWQENFYNSYNVSTTTAYAWALLHKPLPMSGDHSFGYGLFMKEAPLVQTSASSNQSAIQGLRVLGTQFDFDSKGQWSPRFRWDLNFALLLDLFSLHTPNGGALDPSFGAGMTGKLYFASIAKAPIYLSLNLFTNEIRYANSSSDIDLNTGQAMSSGSSSYSRETSVTLQIGSDIAF